MRNWLQPVTVLLLATAALSSATAATTYAVPAKAEIKLNYGNNEVKAGDMVLQIVKSFVGTLTASGFDTFTTFVLPDKKSERWLLVTAPADMGIGYNFRNYETGDANMRAVSFFKERGQLFAVAAERDSASTTEDRAKKGGVMFHVYKFNGDWDVPQFDPDGSMRAKQQYQDADEALKKEFYKR
jgi:hypothetical protein